MSEYNDRPLNPLKAVHNFTKAVDKCPDNQVNLNSSGTVGTGKPVHFTEYKGFHISGVLIVHQQQLSIHINTSETKRSVCNIVDGRFSGVAVWQGSTVFANEAICKHFSVLDECMYSYRLT